MYDILTTSRYYKTPDRWTASPFPVPIPFPRVIHHRVRNPLPGMSQQGQAKKTT
jgi:hypothetical protein